MSMSGLRSEKLVNLARIVTGSTPPTGNQDNYSEDGIEWIKPDNLMGLKGVSPSMQRVSRAAAEKMEVIPAGSVLVNCIGDVGKFGVTDRPVVTNQQINATIFNKNKVLPEYGKYLIASSKSEMEKQANKVVVAILNKTGQSSITYDVPTLDKQKKAADYLDSKTQTLDKILTAKNDTHTHLSELRQAIITNAVLGTGGAAMNLQSTNIPWIGKIPAHWQVKKIKHVASVKARIGWQALTTDEYIDEGPFLVTGTDFRDGIVDWKTAAHVSDQRWAIDSNIQLEEDDLLLTKDGTIGKVAMVKGLVGKATLNSGVFVIRAKNDEYNPRYLYHVLSSGVFTDFIEYMKTGSTINHLYQKTFVEFSFPMPPRKEQDDIVKVIDKRLEQVDTALEKATNSTRLLEEYRSSLISNVVGGKVEV
jgi:type I restriction enzyme S subunit